MIGSALGTLSSRDDIDAFFEAAREFYSRK